MRRRRWKRTRRGHAPARPKATSVRASGVKQLRCGTRSSPKYATLCFLGSGAMVMLFLIFLVELLTGMRLSYVAGLATGAAASFCVEQYLRWRRERTELASR